MHYHFLVLIVHVYRYMASTGPSPAFRVFLSKYLEKTSEYLYMGVRYLPRNVSTKRRTKVRLDDVY